MIANCGSYFIDSFFQNKYWWSIFTWQDVAGAWSWPWSPSRSSDHASPPPLFTNNIKSQFFFLILLSIFVAGGWSNYKCPYSTVCKLTLHCIRQRGILGYCYKNSRCTVLLCTVQLSDCVIAPFRKIVLGKQVILLYSVHCKVSKKLLHILCYAKLL